jgi:hypothetical protein
VRGGDRILIRYDAPSVPESLALANIHLADEIAEGEYAALVYDGYATTGDQVRSDAFVAEILGAHGERLGRVVQTYQRARPFGLPVLGRGCTSFGEPSIEESTDHDDPVAAIYEGVRGHPSGRWLFRLPRQ